jgi:hypothetical protein
LQGGNLAIEFVDHLKNGPEVGVYVFDRFMQRSLVLIHRLRRIPHLVRCSTPGITACGVYQAP